MNWNVPDMWTGGECWIIGGGPSMPRQFGIPEKLIASVMLGSAPVSEYSPYLKPIHDKHVIGINNAYMIGNWIDICFFGDNSWYLVHRENLYKFPGLKVTCCPRFMNRRKEEMEGIKYLAKDKKQRFGISGNSESVTWNGNSGAAAISLAIALGVKTIYLLGFDMTLDKQGKTHWHGGHKKDQNRLGKRRFTPPFHLHLRGFPLIAEQAALKEVDIYNTNSESAIRCFRFKTVKEILGIEEGL